jgi:hypothetical protein
MDVGLLGAMAGTPVELLVQGKRLFNEYEGGVCRKLCCPATGFTFSTTALLLAK